MKKSEIKTNKCTDLKIESFFNPKKSVVRLSAKEIAVMFGYKNVNQAAKAASIGLLNNLYPHGYKLDDDKKEILHTAQKLFEKIMEKGIIPGELNMLKD